MKKLKIISLCFLISLLFIPKAYALVTKNFTLRTNNFSYVSNYVNTNNKSSDEFYSILADVINYTPSYSNYVCALNGTRVYCYSSDTSFQINTFLLNGNYFLSLYLPANTDYNYTQYNITFNSNYVPVSSTISVNSNTNTTSSGSKDILYFSNANTSYKIGYIPFISNIVNLPLISTGASAVNSISFNGSSSYSVGNVVNLSDFAYNTIYSASVFDPYTNPYKCTVNPSGFRTSSLSNISDFEYRITADNLSSDDYGIEGSFAFQNSSFSLSDNNFNSSDYWEIEVIKGPDSVGDYNVNGVLSWDNTNKILTVDYGVYATDSEPVKVDCIIKLKPKGSYSEEFFSGTLNFYSCNPTNPNISLNDSYGYTDNTTGLTNSYDTSLMNFLNNTSNPDLQIFSNLGGLLPPGPVDSILTIPLQMLNSINNFLGSDCQPFNLTLPWVNQQVQLKCIRSFYSDINATTFVESVGSIASVVILVQYFIGLYNWIDSNIQVTHNKLKSWGAGEV